MKRDGSTIHISRQVKDFLDVKKLVEQESYDSVLRRLLRVPKR